MSYLELARQAMTAKKATEWVRAHNAQARAQLDVYFIQVIDPELAALHKSGRLPSLATDPTWAEIERLWEQASVDSPVQCDVECVKAMMAEAVKRWKEKT